MKPLIKQARSFPVTIYIGGSYRKAIDILQEYCDDVSYCVTVQPTLYVYKGGKEPGIKVGLINYPRFPSDPTTITNKAFEIANKLRVGLSQETFSVETPHSTIWHSHRKEDLRED